jgi:uncharacterized membrane protein
MIEAHTVDAWTRASDRRSAAFAMAGILGGFAAPLFLWLAGVAVAFAVNRSEAAGLGRRRALTGVCRRGLEIFVLAFLFRLQAFIVSPGGSPLKLFRVDILNVMGPAIVAAGLLWSVGTSRAARIGVYTAAAAAVALATPLVRAAHWVDAIPIWLQWYVRPAGEYTTFTLFPWSGFVLAGVACGLIMTAAVDRGGEDGSRRALLLAGVACVIGGAYASTRPTIYQESSFWTTSPTWFFIRLGVMMLALAILDAIATTITAERAEHAGRIGSAGSTVSRLRWLERFGRSSLFVYWIHVELVYGYSSWLWRGRLPLWGTAVGFVLFSAVMLGAVHLRDAIVNGWRNRPKPAQTPQPATV